jgi:hypothetical protein
VSTTRPAGQTIVPSCHRTVMPLCYLAVMTSSPCKIGHAVVSPYHSLSCHHAVMPSCCCIHVLYRLHRPAPSKRRHLELTPHRLGLQHSAARQVTHYSSTVNFLTYLNYCNFSTRVIVILTQIYFRRSRTVVMLLHCGLPVVW